MGQRRCRLALLLTCLAAPTWAADLQLGVAGGNFSVPTTSLREARFATTLRQQYDFSCGSAAVATLLTYHYGYAVKEDEVFRAMFQTGDQAKIRREGFSMLDMKRYIDGIRDFRTAGVHASLDQLAQAKVPAIALIRENGYAHFVVVKGVRDSRVLIGDPAGGTRVMPRADFEQQWINHVLLVINNRVDLARFNRDEDWRVRPSAHLDDGLGKGTVDVLLLRPGPTDF